MMRFLGVLVGSAFAVAALVVFVGIPEFTAESNVTEPTVITLPMRTAAPATAAATDTPPEPVADDAPANPPPDIPPETPPEMPPEIQDAEPSATPQWYAFWSPFRSEVAANGFVDQLQRVTGLDYRVVKVKTGVYEVAFAYEDDQDITANLSQISAATGLQLPES